MSASKPPKLARPFVNFFFTDDEALESSLKAMDKYLGPRVFTSAVGAFDLSNYYEPEMGGKVRRLFAAWKELIDPSRLVEMKLRAWEIEKQHLAQVGGRKVNIDPGLVEEGKFVLATGKNSSPHRPYMGRGVYVDITLIFENKTYKPLPWTYRDYAGAQIIAMLNQLRAEYLHDRNALDKKEMKA